MRYNESFINEIKLRIPISKIIGLKVAFDNKKSNITRGNFWACCPFHIEKTPSFCCNDSKANYHCFGCHESGDIFNFIMKIEGLSFSQAVKKLAMLAGLELPKLDKHYQLQQTKKFNIYDILEKGCKFFEKSLNQEAILYLKNRQLTTDTIQNFRIGYSGEKKALRAFLKQQNISEEQMLQSGLLAKNATDGSLYERFVERIIFPIKDTQDRIIGFGGRTLQANIKAKYINTAETEVFFKGKILYNLKQAREYCYKNRKTGSYEINNGADITQELIVVEGYMDVISLYQVGLKNAVAPLGTALTEEQVKLLWQSSMHPILCFDGDEAGLKAAYRTVERMLPILEPQFSLRFALLPQGQDPDDIIRTEGREGFITYLASAKSLLELLWQKETENINFTSPENCASIEKKLLTAVQTIKNKNLKQHYLQILKAKWKNFLYEQRRNNFFNTKPKVSNKLTKHLEQRINTNIVIREDILIALLMQNPILFYEKYEDIENISFVKAELNNIYKKMLLIIRENSNNLTAEEFQKLLQNHIKDIDLIKLQEKVKYIGIKTCGTNDENKNLLEQILHLYNKAYLLKKQLKKAEKQIEDQESFFAMLVNIKKTITELETSFITKN